MQSGIADTSFPSIQRGSVPMPTLLSRGEGSSGLAVVTTIAALAVGIVVVTGGLFLAAGRMSEDTSGSGSPHAKIGPILTQRALAPAVPARQPDQPLPPTQAPAAARDVEAAPAAPQPAAPESAPSDVQQAVLPAEPAQPAAPLGERYPKGSAGCTQYKTYDARTQTYRGFDGVVHECKPAATGR